MFISPAALTACSKVAATTSTRYSLNSVMVRYQPDGLGTCEAFGTDGKLLLRTRWAAPVAGDILPAGDWRAAPDRTLNNKAEVLIRLDDVKRIVSAAPKKPADDARAFIGLEDTSCNGTMRMATWPGERGDTPPAVTTLNSAEGYFPPVNSVIPNEITEHNHHSVTVDVYYLEKMVDALKATMAKGRNATTSVKIRLPFKTGAPVIFERRDPDTGLEAFGLLMPISEA